MVFFLLNFLLHQLNKHCKSLVDYYAFLVSFIQLSLIVPPWENSGCPCGAAISAAGAAVYLGGSPDDVKTGVANP